MTRTVTHGRMSNEEQVAVGVPGEPAPSVAATAVLFGNSSTLVLCTPVKTDCLPVVSSDSSSDAITQSNHTYAS